MWPATIQGWPPKPIRRNQSSQLYFLRDHEDPIKEHSFSSDELRDTEEKILHVSNGIRKKDFKPIKGNHCNWCDYKHLACPVYEE